MLKMVDFFGAPCNLAFPTDLGTIAAPEKTRARENRSVSARSSAENAADKK